MANSLSARQRIEVNKRNQLRNKAYKFIYAYYVQEVSNCNKQHR